MNRRLKRSDGGLVTPLGVALLFFACGAGAASSPGGDAGVSGPEETGSIPARPTDPDFALQWGLENVGQPIRGVAGLAGADVSAVGAWRIYGGGSNVTVAIIGRGIDPHPEYADRLLAGRAFVGDLFNTFDHCLQDTHLAGVTAAAADNGVGIAGLNPLATILPVRVVDGCLGTPQPAAEGIRWAVDQGTHVVLATMEFFHPNAALAAAVAYAAEHDAVVIAPAGNDGNSSVAYPAALDGVLAVAATTNLDTVASASNSGPEVDLAAPGVDIWSTRPGGGFGFLEAGKETTTAAALVAGAAALVRSYAPQLSAAEVSAILIETADDLGPPGRDVFYGAGRLNVRAALEAAPPPPLRIVAVEPFPDTLPPQRSQSFVVRIDSVAERLRPKRAFLSYRIDQGEFVLQPLTPIGQDRFLATFPALPCQTKVDYAVLAMSGDGTLVADPIDTPVSLHRAEVVARRTRFSDDFETDRGWEVVGGTRGTGRWSRVVPVGTSAQPGFDHSPGRGSVCYVTGQHFGGSDGTDDVDGGPVELLSPVIALTTDDAEISYARWFVSSGVGIADFLTVDLSRDGGVSWTTIETVSSGGAWEVHRARLGDFPSLTGDELRVRFSTVDEPNDSLTEAAIDDFRVDAIRCALPPGDADFTGTTDLADLRTLVECLVGPTQLMPRGECSASDVNADLSIDLADYHLFLGAFGASGP